MTTMGRMRIASPSAMVTVEDMAEEMVGLGVDHNPPMRIMILMTYMSK